MAETEQVRARCGHGNEFNTSLGLNDKGRLKLSTGKCRCMLTQGHDA